MKTIQDMNKELAIQHWKYIEGLLDVSLLAEETYDMDTVIAMCRFHYITAWEHGAKHYAELLKEYNQNEDNGAIEDMQKAWEYKNDSKSKNDLRRICLSPEHVEELLKEL